MAPYLILFTAVVIFGFLLCEWRPSRRNDIIFLSVVSVAMVVFSVLRADTVGVDYPSYLGYFQKVCDGGLGFLFSAENGYRIEIGYGLVNFIISLFGHSQIAFATGIAVLSVGLTAVFLYRHSPSIWLSTVVFIGFGFFGYTLCTLRHQLAICIFMFALPYLQKKKFLPYLLIVLLTATFHKSMLVLIPVYFLAQLALNWKSLVIYGAGTLAFMAFSDLILEFLTQYIYKGYQESGFLWQGRDLRTGWFPILFFAAVYVFKPLLLKRNPQNLPLMNLSLYSALLFVLTFKHFLFQRFALILLPVSMLLLPEITRCLAVEPDKLAELSAAKAAASVHGGNKKQASKRYIELKLALRDQQALYYAAIGGIILLSLVYFLFLLTANRLLLAPYVVMEF